MKKERALVCGVDEAGRGPLAGPVVAGAVILGPATRISGLRDSKKLGARRREELAEEIREECMCWSLGVSGVEEVDKFNIRSATMFAMQRAVDAIVICPMLSWWTGILRRIFRIWPRPLWGGMEKCRRLWRRPYWRKSRATR